MKKPLSDRHERLAQARALGHKPADAARLAGYKGSGETFAANARRACNKPHVMARVAELLAPAVAKVEQQIEHNMEWAVGKLAAIVDRELDPKDIKPADVIAAARQLAAIRGWNAPTTVNVNKHVNTDWSTEELVAFIVAARASLGASRERGGEADTGLEKPDQIH
jgi:hypothetical protein